MGFSVAQWFYHNSVREVEGAHSNSKSLKYFLLRPILFRVTEYPENNSPLNAMQRNYFGNLQFGYFDKTWHVSLI